MSSELAIRARGLSKCYPIFDHPQDRLKQMLSFGRHKYYRDFWALKDVDLDVNRGETVGIVGRNGSGKSTLLQLICGTLMPTSGSIEINGRIAALLELGSGFNPEFTGRENVYLNAILLGLARDEVDARFEDIAAFSDIGEFIEQPVKTYSSGMVVRLAFAVIAYVDADILVVDEALSVGDVFFAQKCIRFFERFQSEGGTVLFVSHDTAAVMNLCRRAVLLVRGSVHQSGSADAVCKTYLKQMYDDRLLHVPEPLSNAVPPASVSPVASNQVLEFVVPKQEPNRIIVSPFNADSASFGVGGARILDAGFFNEDGRRLSELLGGSTSRFSITLTSEKHMRFPAIGLALKDRLGQPVFTESTTWAFGGQYGEGKLEFLPGDIVRVDFDHKVPELCEGDYAITVAVAEGFGHDHVQYHYMHEALILRSIGRRLLHGIAGFTDLRAAIRISRGTPMPAVAALQTSVR